MSGTLYSRINAAHCNHCGAKGGIAYNGRIYRLPATVLTTYVETTRLRCECGLAVRLIVLPVEGD